MKEKFRCTIQFILKNKYNFQNENYFLNNTTENCETNRIESGKFIATCNKNLKYTCNYINNKDNFEKSLIMIRNCLTKSLMEQLSQDGNYFY